MTMARKRADPLPGDQALSAGEDERERVVDSDVRVPDDELREKRVVDQFDGIDAIDAHRWVGSCSHPPGPSNREGRSVAAQAS